MTTANQPGSSVSFDCGRQWYAVQSKPRQEDRVERNLAAWGVESFLPRIRLTGRRSVTFPPRTEPLFPGYLFVRSEAEALVSKLRYTRGVYRLVGTCDGPALVDDEIIALIRRRLDEDGYVPRTPALAAGDHVRITNGPLKDIVAVFETSTKAADRVRLLLSALNSRVRLVVDTASIERMAPSSVGNGAP